LCSISEKNPEKLHFSGGPVAASCPAVVLTKAEAVGEDGSKAQIRQDYRINRIFFAFPEERQKGEPS